ncbi:MAG: hypothetical protein JW751_29445 [Polyangiaceae bacterium]|nr:hypothetical protein [Polyangiaceae bacterium]
MGHSSTRTSALVSVLGIVAPLGACNEPYGVDVLPDRADASAPTATPSNDATPIPALHAGGEGSADECLPVGTFAPPTVAPLNIVFLVETSSVAPPREAAGVIREFLGNPATDGMRVGLSFFPKETKCEPSAYTGVEVPMEELDLAASDSGFALIEAAQSVGLRGTMVSLDAAILGTLGYARVDIERRPEPLAERMVVIVVLATGPRYVSEELASGEWYCEANPQPPKANAWTRVRRALSAAREDSDHPATYTYLVGVGTQFTGSSDFVAGARAAAKAGGGLYLDAQEEDYQGALFDSLREVSRGEFGCEYSLPVPPGGREFDYDLFGLTYAAGDGPETDLRQTNEDACGVDGWYYDDPEAPRSIRLCPALCRLAQSKADPRVTVHFGCRPIVPW